MSQALFLELGIKVGHKTYSDVYCGGIHIKLVPDDMGKLPVVLTVWLKDAISTQRLAIKPLLRLPGGFLEEKTQIEPCT